MSAFDMHNSPRCQHVHYSGRPCKAPARRGRNYCVFHQAAHLDPGGCVLPIIEDVHSYQLAIIRILNALAADAIDSKKATALLYGLQLIGGRLNDFTKQREEVENPTVALKKEITERYDARRYPFPAHVPEKDLLAILKDLAREHPAEPNDNIEITPPRTEPSGASGDGIGLVCASDGVGSVRPLDEIQTVPEGPIENSPALQRRVEPQISPSAVGTTDFHVSKSKPGTLGRLEACAEPIRLHPRKSAARFSAIPIVSGFRWCSGRECEASRGGRLLFGSRP